MKPIIANTLAVLLVLLTASSSSAETLELRSGEVLIGDVQVREDGRLDVVVHFPTPRTIELAKDELTPLSYFQVLERRVDVKDAAARFDLGKTAEELGLHGQAVAHYRAAVGLDAGLEKRVSTRVQSLVEGIAAGLLAQVKELVDDGRLQVAVMYLQSLLEHYPETAAAKEARTLLAETEDRLAVTEARKSETPPPAKLERALKIVDAHFTKGQNLFKPIRGHVLGSVRRQRAGERALRHYEAAWEAARQLPTEGVADDGLAKRIAEAASRAKETLVLAYLELGTIHVQRRSIPAAEGYCQKACELDPENKDNHDLHKLIMQAKTVYYGDSR